MMFICPIIFAPLKMDSVLKTNKQQKQQQKQKKPLEIKLKVCTLVTF